MRVISKKIFSAIIFCTVTLGTVTTLRVYADSGVHKFSRVSGNDMVTFAVKSYQEDVLRVETCPVDAGTLCVYDDYLYYCDGVPSGDEERCKIYRCNLDGSDKIMIADNASSWGEAFIVNDMLYYTACEFSYNPWDKISGGIYKVNLNDFSWRRIVSDLYADLICCDSEYVFYRVEQGFYRIDNNGTCCWAMSENDVEMSLDYYNNGDGYYADETGIYFCNWDRSTVRKLTDMPRTVKHDVAAVYNVTGGYVYFSFYADNYLFLYRTPVIGGECEYISKRMAAGGGLY